jgi:hypothetical protein
VVDLVDAVRRDHHLDERNSERFRLPRQQLAPNAVHADPLVRLGHRRDQCLRLELLATKRPEGERRVLAAAPGKRKGRPWPRSKRGGVTETRRTPRPRVDRLSAHKNLRVCGGGGPAAGAARTALPPRADFRFGTGRSTWLIPSGGASQLRDSAGFAPDFAASAPAGDYVPDAASIPPTVIDGSAPFDLTLTVTGRMVPSAHCGSVDRSCLQQDEQLWCDGGGARGGRSDWAWPRWCCQRRRYGYTRARRDRFPALKACVAWRQSARRRPRLMHER